jgi:glycosyltransferase involved in cell wall biosynthesis
LPVISARPGSGTCDRDWKGSDLVVVSQGACKDGLEWLEWLCDAGKDYVILCQANMECDWPGDAEVDRLIRVYSAAKKVYFVSAENERLFRIQTGYEGTNTALAWNPLQPATPREPLEWPSASDGDTWSMAMVGRIEPFAKGQDLMLEVLCQEKWRQRNLKVTIFGQGPWQQTARRIVEQRALKQVNFGGFATPAEIWKQHQMLALPSRHEGMSLAMLEAMWLGRPVVATAVAGACSEIEHHSNGFLCAAPTVDSWDQAMEDAWQSRHEWADMGRVAAVRIRERMNGDPIENFAEDLVKVAGQVAKQGA